MREIIYIFVARQGEKWLSTLTEWFVNLAEWLVNLAEWLSNLAEWFVSKYVRLNYI